MFSPDVCKSFFATPLPSSDFWTASAEPLAFASASDTEGAVATTDRSSRNVSGMPATSAVAPTVMPAAPTPAIGGGRVDELLLAPVKAAAGGGVPAERFAPTR